MNIQTGAFRSKMVRTVFFAILIPEILGIALLGAVRTRASEAPVAYNVISAIWVVFLVAAPCLILGYFRTKRNEGALQDGSYVNNYFEFALPCPDGWEPVIMRDWRSVVSICKKGTKTPPFVHVRVCPVTQNRDSITKIADYAQAFARSTGFRIQAESKSVRSGFPAYEVSYDEGDSVSRRLIVLGRKLEYQVQVVHGKQELDADDLRHLDDCVANFSVF